MQTLRFSANKPLSFTIKYSSGALWGPVHERPIIDRVVSTSQWPVPYYQRHFKAYPIREDKISKKYLTSGGNDVDDIHWYLGKQFLNRTLKGRQAVQYVENNLNMKSYLMIQKDVTKMAQAYVSDIGLFLNSANKENKVILDSVDLI